MAFATRRWSRSESRLALLDHLLRENDISRFGRQCAPKCGEQNILEGDVLCGALECKRNETLCGEEIDDVGECGLRLFKRHIFGDR